MSSYENRRARLVARASENVCAMLGSKQIEVAAAMEARRVLATVDSPFKIVEYGKTLPAEVTAILKRTAPEELAAATTSQSVVEQASALRGALDTTYRAVGIATRNELVAATDRFIKSSVPDVKVVTTRTDGDRVIVQSDAGGGKVATYEFGLHGQFSVDRVGYEGTSCTAEQQAYEENLRTQGIYADVVQSVFHGGKNDSVFAPSTTHNSNTSTRKAV